MFNGSRPRIQNCYQSEWTQFIAITRHEHASKSWKEESGTNFLIWIHFDRNTDSVVVLIRVEYFHNWQDCSFLVVVQGNCLCWCWHLLEQLGHLSQSTCFLSASLIISVSYSLTNTSILIQSPCQKHSSDFLDDLFFGCFLAFNWIINNYSESLSYFILPHLIYLCQI